MHAGFHPSERTGEGETPLHLAARNGYLSIVQFLIKAGAEVEAKTCTLGYPLP